MRQTMTLRVAAMAIERRVTVTRVVSIFVTRPFAVCLTQFELHSDFDDDIDRRAVTPGGGEAPLAHRLGRALVESGAETLQELDGADGAVAPPDELEHDVSLQSSAASVLRGTRLDLVHDR